ncbi:MAG: hypothetical protein EBZ50_04535, partial [Alphaproteobacteria bacterium]|nr:hypothetical protein [Alphaproteobacteria bacterium]
MRADARALTVDQLHQVYGHGDRGPDMAIAALFRNTTKGLAAIAREVGVPATGTKREMVARISIAIAHKHGGADEASKIGDFFVTHHGVDRGALEPKKKAARSKATGPAKVASEGDWEALFTRYGDGQPATPKAPSRDKNHDGYPDGYKPKGAPRKRAAAKASGLTIPGPNGGENGIRPSPPGSKGFRIVGPKGFSQTVYDKVSVARWNAKQHAEHHGTKFIVVNADGSKIERGESRAAKRKRGDPHQLFWDQVNRVGAFLPPEKQRIRKAA